jgi:O-antigen ligase
MQHGQLAELAACVGALGVAAILLGRTRRTVLAGIGILGAAEVALAVALVPAHDIYRLLPALVVATVAAGAGGAALARWPAVIPVALLVAAPFRVPLTVGHERAFLLLPLYGTLVAATIAFLVGVVRDGRLQPLPRVVAVPATAFLVFDAVSLTWSHDVREGSIELLFFLFPFGLLVAIVGRLPLARWLPRALAVTLVAMATVFAAIGLWQLWSHHLFFAQDLEVANAYTTYFRVTSLFKDPSLYGRELVAAMAVLLLALWRGWVRPLLGVALIAFLSVGLYFSYSQSSFVTLFVVAAAIALIFGERRTRFAIVAVIAAIAVGGSALVAATSNDSHTRLTSGRSRLVHVTAVVFEHHPVVGVGIGAQPKASREDAHTHMGPRRDASHTTALTVAAELGIVGIIGYVVLLAGAAVVLAAAARRRPEIGLGAAAVFFVVFVHSFSYSGFFEDPLTWGSLALSAAVLYPLRPREPTPDVGEQVRHDGPAGGPAEVHRPGREDLGATQRPVVRHLSGASAAEDVRDPREDDRAGG